MRKSDWAIIIFGIVLLICVSYLSYLLIVKSPECLNNPIVYGVREYSKNNDVEFSCSCSFDHPRSPLIKFTKEGRQKVEMGYFNLSLG